MSPHSCFGVEVSWKFCANPSVCEGTAEESPAKNESEAEVVLLNNAESVTPASYGGVWLVLVTSITCVSECSTHL